MVFRGRKTTAPIFVSPFLTSPPLQPRKYSEFKVSFDPNKHHRSHQNLKPAENELMTVSTQFFSETPQNLANKPENQPEDAQLAYSSPNSS